MRSRARLAIVHEARLRLHLRKMRPKLDGLRRNGRSNQQVLAILAVESFYRPSLRRAVEYAAWCILSLLGSESVARVTVGIAQARVSHWFELGLLDGERFSPGRLRRVLDPEANYEVCRRYLSERGMLAEADVGALTLGYTGGSRADYSRMLERALAAVAC